MTIDSRIFLRNPEELYKGTTLLHWAAKHGKPNDIQELVNKGARIDSTNHCHSWTPLLVAAVNDQPGNVRTLVNLGARKNAKTKEGYTALHLAVVKANLGVAFELISQDRELLKEQDNRGFTPLYLALMIGRFEIFEYLMLSSCTQMDSSDLPLMHMACYKKNIPMKDMQYLVNWMREEPKPTKNGHTLFHVCAALDNKECFKVAMRCFPNIWAADDCGNTPLHIAALNNSVEFGMFSLNLDPPIDQQNMDGNSALHLASIRGSTAFVKILLDHGANVNLRNFKMNTPLIVASRYGHKYLAILLIQHQADMSCRNVDSLNAVGAAALFKHNILAKKLLKYMNA